MALYGIFVIPLLSLLPLIAALTIHPVLDRRDALKHRLAERAAAKATPAPVAAPVRTVARPKPQPAAT